MRSPLGKELRKLFKAMMKVQFPDFKQNKKWISPQGWYTWTCEHSCGLQLHILLVIHHSNDSFTNEVAWNYGEKQPEHRALFNDEINMFVRQPMRIRIAKFWSNQDYWWSFDPEYDDCSNLGKDLKPMPIEKSMELIVPAIYDSAKKLKKYVLPAFEDIIGRHGKAAPQDKG
jgi:hypothetical protein